MTFKQDLFDCKISLVEASAKEVDGKSVLGKLSGQFFVPNGISRNKRFYPKSLWEKQLARPEIKDKINNRRMFATISHDQPIDDQALLEGKISHLITSLYIDPVTGKGMGEALILNTPAGQILNNVLRAGGNLYVSSRASGKFEGETQEGIPIVDPDSYSLSTFDVVMDPGFLQANPTISESFNKIFSVLEDGNEGDDMLNEKLIRENQDLTNSVTALAEAKTAAEKKAAALEAEKATNEARVAKLEAELTELKSYRDLGTITELNAVLDKSTAKLEALGKANKALSAVVEKFKEVGTVEEMTKLITTSESHFKQLQTYRKLGTVSELESILKFAETSVSSRDSKRKAREIAEIAQKAGVTTDAVEKLYGKMTPKEILEFLAGVKNVGKWQDTSAPGKSPKVGENDGVTGSFGKSRTVGDARGIMETLVKVAKPSKTQD